MNSRIALLGLPIDKLTLAEAVKRAFELIDCYQKDNRPRYVATVNTDFLVQTHGWFTAPRNPKLLSALRAADLSTADGMPLVWLSKALSEPLPERVAGSDMLPLLCEGASKRGDSVFLLGGSEILLERTAAVLKQRYPSLQIAGTASPQVSKAGEVTNPEKLIDAINQANPAILLLNLGNLKQELFFQNYRHLLKVPLTVGVGGAFAFLSGDISRAPAWMQKAGVEWAYRLYQEPARLFSRYFVGAFKLMRLSIPLLVTSKPLQWAGSPHYRSLSEQHSLSQNPSSELSSTTRYLLKVNKLSDLLAVESKNS